MLRRRPAEVSINHERWLVSYADFVTLLFAFFVVMYAVSQMHENKYRELSETLEELFTSSEAVETKEIGIDKLGENQPILVDGTFLASQPLAAVNNTMTEQGNKPLAVLPELAGQLHHQFSDLIESDAIDLSYNESWLKVSLNNRVLFPLGSVVPSHQANAIFEEIAQLLQGYRNPIQVEGFTDNLTMRSEQFPSNWELSAARAAAIVRLLITYGMPSVHLSAVGYGELHPIADNSTAAGRAQNRRVTLMIGQHPRHRPQDQLMQKSPPSSRTVESTAVVKSAPLLPQPSSPVLTTANNNNNDGIEPITLKSGELLFTSDPKERGR